MSFYFSWSSSCPTSTYMMIVEGPTTRLKVFARFENAKRLSEAWRGGNIFEIEREAGEWCVRLSGALLSLHFRLGLPAFLRGSRGQHKSFCTTRPFKRCLVSAQVLVNDRKTRRPNAVTDTMAIDDPLGVSVDTWNPYRNLAGKGSPPVPRPSRSKVEVEILCKISDNLEVRWSRQNVASVAIISMRFSRLWCSNFTTIIHEISISIYNISMIRLKWNSFRSLADLIDMWILAGR